jgi:hypothetical protein
MLDEERSDGLQRLWEAYRRATPEPAVSVNFTPQLWARIEAARPTSWTMPLTRLASRLVPLAAALTLAMSAYLWIPQSRTNANSQTGYVDVLASDLLEQQHPALWVANAEDSI